VSCVNDKVAAAVDNDDMFTEAPYLPLGVISNTTIIENNRVVLPCPVRGTPQPDVTWYRGDTQVVNHRVTSEGSLVLEHPTANDTAQYRCVAENIAGNVSHTVDLLVFGTTFLPPTRVVVITL